MPLPDLVDRVVATSHLLERAVERQFDPELIGQHHLPTQVPSKWRYVVTLFMRMLLVVRHSESTRCAAYRDARSCVSRVASHGSRRESPAHTTVPRTTGNRRLNHDPLTRTCVATAPPR